MLTVKQIIFSTLRFCNGAVYLADLWHTNDRLTAAGDTIALRIALEQAELKACGQGLSLEVKVGGGFTQGCALVTHRTNQEKHLRM